MKAFDRLPGPLAGITVLITRPLHQAERVAKAIEAAGGEAFLFPTMEIQPAGDRGALFALADRLSDYDMVIFVSANAVEQGMPYLTARCEIPAELVFAAIGEATRQALRERGIGKVLTPTGRYDSEGLLELPEMQDVAGKRMLIFRGEGGRELLGEVLRSRGATVDYAVCYRRVRPQQDANELRARWGAGNIHAVSAMSFESLQNLCEMVGAEMRVLLAKTPLFVPHPRIAERAREIGFTDVRVTGAGDSALIESLERCRKT